MLAALLLGLLARPQASADALAREWWVRAAARAPQAAATELARALEDPLWRARAAALDALARAAGEGAPFPAELDAAAARALSDPHPSVRARALDLYGAAGRELCASDVARLAAEPLATVRLALARALAHAPAPGRAAQLLALARDPDERVRVAAQAALCALEPDEPGVDEARLALLAALAAEEDLQAFARFGLRLAQAPLEPRWIEAARAAAAGLDPARRALLEALAFARTGEGDAARLVAGAARDEDWEPAGARLLALAARAGSRELAQALLAELARAPQAGPGRRGRVELLLDTLGAEAAAFLRTRAPEAALLAELLGELGLRRDAWDFATCEPWTAPAAALEVRRALLAALTGAFARSADAGAARLLVRFLADPEPDLAARAFEALCGARVAPEDVDAALAAAHAALDEEERGARLGWFARERPFPALLASWIELGRAGGERRAAVCELLAGADAAGPEASEVRAALLAWLREDLARVAAGARPERALEQRVQAELRALARLAPAPDPLDAADALTAEFAAALELSLGRSPEIGKVAAAALGRSVAGSRVLEQHLRAGDLAHEGDRRTRIEVCLVLARAPEAEPRAAACEQLLADREGAAWDLRERMLRALGTSGLAPVQAELARLALTPGLEPVERVELALLLAEQDGPAARAALRDLARDGFELEARRVALRALGALGDEQALLPMFAALRRDELAGAADELPLVRGELLVAVATLAAAPAGLCEEWLRAPLARAPHDLAQRFAGAELAATEFAWRHELELAAVLARARAAGECLASAGAWERLDARTLLALGEALEEHDPESAQRLFAAGAIGLAGEPDTEAGLLAHAHARRLALVWRLGHWEAAAALAAQVLAARRDGALAERDWARLFGAFERTAGIDPDARVRALLWQARARLALARGAPEQARAAAARAARACGLSRLAHEVQAELEAELRAADPRGSR